MKVASIQISVVEDDKIATIDKAIENIQRCKGIDLVILPEIWNIGFMSFDRYVSEAEDHNGQTLTRLREAANRSEFICIPAASLRRKTVTTTTPAI